ncbi:hypothetical protein AAG906_011635 [Vitis piasezkii]
MEKHAISYGIGIQGLVAIKKLNMDLSRARLKRGDFKAVGHVLKDSWQRKNPEEKNSPRHFAHSCEIYHGPKAYFLICIWHEGPLLPFREFEFPSTCHVVYYRCPMLTTPPIEGNSLQIETFPLEIYFDREALR